jgi:hypothetical protein
LLPASVALTCAAFMNTIRCMGLHGIAERQPVHDLAHVGCAHSAVSPRLGRGPARKHPVPVRPFRYRQVRVGPQPAAPCAQDLARAVEVRQAIFRPCACAPGIRPSQGSTGPLRFAVAKPVLITGSRAGPRRAQ